MNVRDILRVRDIVGRRRRRGWDDRPGDPLVAALEAIALRPIDATAPVERRRSMILSAFDAANVHAARRAQPLHRLSRMALALATTATLVAVTVGGIAASSAGRPLYGVRLAAEELLLPAGGPERTLAQLDRLDRRLGEATLAISDGDQAAANAALDAYDGIATQLMAGSRPGSADSGAMVVRLQTQLELLERLRAGDPGPGPAASIRLAGAILAWLGAAPPDAGPATPEGSGSPGQSPGTPPWSPAPQPTGAGGQPGPSGPAGTSGPPPSAGPNGPARSPGAVGSNGPGSTHGPTGSGGG